MTCVPAIGLAPLSAEKSDYAYDEGKWSIKEVVMHLADSERTFGYRALCFARSDPAALPEFEQNTWVANSSAGRRSLEIFFDSHHGVEHWNVAAALAEYGLTVADIRAAQSQKEN